MQWDSVQAALGERSMMDWSASHAEVTFAGRMLGSALLAMTAWTYSLKVRCLALAAPGQCHALSLCAPGTLRSALDGTVKQQRKRTPTCGMSVTIARKPPAHLIPACNCEIKTWAYGNLLCKHVHAQRLCARICDAQEAADNRVMHRRPFKLLQGGMAAVSALNLAAIAPALACRNAGRGAAVLCGLWAATAVAALRNLLKNLGPPVK